MRDTEYPEKANESRVKTTSLAAEALAQELEEARQADAITYMARLLLQATMPHLKPETNEIERSNGALTLSMWAP